jgi:hypothetical protein
MPIDAVLDAVPMRVLWGALSLYSFAESSVKILLDFFHRLAKAYSIVFRPNYYLFFEGSSQAFPFYSVNHWATGSAAPELMYCPDKKLFFPWIPRNPEAPGEGMDFSDVFVQDRYRPLNILSVEVIDAEGRVAYDLTDFIESVRYVALDGFTVPSLTHILSAWTLSSGIVPDSTRFTLRYIDSDGNMFPQEEGADANTEKTVAESKESEEESKESETQTEVPEDKSETSTAAVISGEAVAAVAEPAATAAET